MLKSTAEIIVLDSLIEMSKCTKYKCSYFHFKINLQAKLPGSEVKV